MCLLFLASALLSHGIHELNVGLVLHGMTAYYLLVVSTLEAVVLPANILRHVPSYPITLLRLVSWRPLRLTTGT